MSAGSFDCVTCFLSWSDLGFRDLRESEHKGKEVKCTRLKTRAVSTFFVSVRNDNSCVEDFTSVTSCDVYDDKGTQLRIG